MDNGNCEQIKANLTPMKKGMLPILSWAGMDVSEFHLSALMP